MTLLSRNLVEWLRKNTKNLCQFNPCLCSEWSCDFTITPSLIDHHGCVISTPGFYSEVLDSSLVQQTSFSKIFPSFSVSRQIRQDTTTYFYLISSSLLPPYIRRYVIWTTWSFSRQTTDKWKAYRLCGITHDMSTNSQQRIFKICVKCKVTNEELLTNP